jgi:hypothetical protein
VSAAKPSSGLLAATLLLGACATPVALPPHVSTRSTEAGAYLDRIDLSYASPSPQDFARLKLCVAETISNDSVGLKDAVGSFVGVTGTYYQAQNQQTAGGGSVFKYIDDASRTAIVSGTVKAQSSILFTSEFVRYELKASTANSAQGAQVGLVFYAITRAQQSTGVLANDGFVPVGTIPGARPLEVVATLEAVAGRLRGCMK